ncbi:MAG: BrnA antitoxin family protein [Pseudomonadota bacterium]
MKKTTTKKRLKENKWNSADDAPALTKEFLKKSVLMPPIADPEWKKKMDALSKGKKSKGKFDVSLDVDVADWFKNHSKDYQVSVNHVLRHYILSHDLPRG